MSRAKGRSLHPGAILAITAGLTALGSLAIHLFVPAMPGAAADLGVSPDAIQLTLTLYLAAMAVGQLVAGPLSDAFGRRPAIIASAFLFVLGSIAAWAATDLVGLLAGRVLQAFGGASGLVASRAMAGDRAGPGATRDVALLMAVVMLSPMLAPVLGAWLASKLGWHSIFALLAAAGLVLGGAAVLFLPESREASRDGLRLGAMAGQWRTLLGDRRFLRNLAIGCSLTAGLYIFLTGSPFLLLRLGVEEGYLGLFFGLVAGAMAIGAISAGWLAGRAQPLLVVRVSACTIAAATILFGMMALAGQAGAIALLATMAVYALGGGLIAPNAMSGAMAAGDGRPGLAVSAYGAIQMTSNAAAAGIAVALPSGSIIAFALALAATAACAAILAASPAS
ncbi:MAG TPA: Bcr/CflA family efflux MFS transporter [Allosphingosinicella sp.]